MGISEADLFRVVPLPRKGMYVTIRREGANLSTEAFHFLRHGGKDRVRWLLRADGRGFGLESLDRGPGYSLATRYVSFPPNMFADLGRDAEAKSFRLPLSIRGSRLVGYFPD